MSVSPKTLRHGFAVGCGLMAAGAVMQIAVGPIDWSIAAWPANIAIVGILAVALLAMYLLRGRVGAFRWLGGLSSAICSIAFALMATVALGLIEQSQSESAPWHQRMVSSWPFAIAYGWLALSLGMAVLRVGSRRWTWRTVAFMLNHLGLLVTLVAATLGSADVERLRMMAGLSSLGYEPQSFAHVVGDADRAIAELDFSVELKDFAIEQEPLRYVSRVAIRGRDGLCIADTAVEVNKPLTVSGWKIYQVGYDQSPDHAPRYTVLELVRDPWLPAVYTGILMMLAGALSLLFTSKRQTAQL